jgi:hypothetical protein
MQDHPPVVDVADLKMQRFAETQTGGITGRQDHAVFLIRDATEKTNHFFRAEHGGQPVAALGLGDGIDSPVLPQRSLTKEPKRGDCAGHRLRRQVSVVDQMQLVRPNIFRSQALGRLTKVPRKPRHVVDVRRLRPR